MSDVIPERTAAEIDGGFVVFRIGLRINALWKIHHWLPTLLAMPRMLRELDADPDSGLLDHQTHLGVRRVTVVWRAVERMQSASGGLGPGEWASARPSRGAHHLGSASPNRR